MRTLFIAPMRAHRVELMEKLPALLNNVPGLKILGTGRNGFKVQVESEAELQKSLQPDIKNRCFIEPVHTFLLAGGR